MQLKLGDKIRALRRKEGRTQEALANALGVTSQAVSRWESNGSYPDMELIPPLANFFGISIDELFGYDNERSRKIDHLFEIITNLNRQNNGVDLCVGECIRLAREGAAEFPGNEKMLFCIASVLYNAGYVRHGEQHLTDAEGYDIYDTERHRGYAEWKEAIKLYESVLPALPDGDLRNRATVQLTQLYVNTGEYEKAENIANTAPDMDASREFLHLNTCDGKRRAAAGAAALMKLVDECADYIVYGVIMNKNHLTPDEMVAATKNAIQLFDMIFTDGDFGVYCAKLTRLHLYLSEHLWRAGQRDEAFSALDAALNYAKKAGAIHKTGGEIAYSSPLLRTATTYVKANPDDDTVTALPKDWPWWAVPDCADVEKEIKADPRWEAWVQKTQA